MSGPKTTRGPAGGAAGTSLSASEATVQSTYFRSGQERKPIRLATVPRESIANAIEALIDALDSSDALELAEAGREDSL